MENATTILNSKWNKKLEESAIHLRNSCLIYKWCHSKMAHRHRIFHKIFENATTILNSIVTAGIVSNILYCTQEYTIQYILLTFVSIIVIIVDRVHSNFSFDSSSDEHKRISIRWGEMYNNIDYQLRLSRTDRNDVTVYMPFIQKLYLSLLEISPDISTSVWKEYKKQFPDSYQNAFTEICETITKEKIEEKDGKKNISSDTERLEKYESERMKYEMDRYFEDGIV